MKLRSVEFWYEALTKLSKQDVIDLFEKYIKEHAGDTYYPQTLQDCIEGLCDDGYFDLDYGIISMVSEYDGCETEDWKDIK